MSGHFLVERDGPTALLTFNRPDARNSMTFEMYEALHEGVRSFLEKRKPDWQGR